MSKLPMAYDDGVFHRGFIPLSLILSPHPMRSGVISKLQIFESQHLKRKTLCKEPTGHFGHWHPMFNPCSKPKQWVCSTFFAIQRFHDISCLVT